MLALLWVKKLPLRDGRNHLLGAGPAFPCGQSKAETVRTQAPAGNPTVSRQARRQPGRGSWVGLVRNGRGAHGARPHHTDAASHRRSIDEGPDLFLTLRVEFSQRRQAKEIPGHVLDQDPPCGCVARPGIQSSLKGALDLRAQNRRQAIGLIGGTSEEFALRTTSGFGHFWVPCVALNAISSRMLWHPRAGDSNYLGCRSVSQAS